MICPNLECEGTYQHGGNREPAHMELITMHGCYVCPWCGSEYWPAVSRDGTVTSGDARAALLDEAKRQNLMRKKGSSSRKSGRKRKDKLEVKGWWARE